MDNLPVIDESGKMEMATFSACNGFACVAAPKVVCDLVAERVRVLHPQIIERKGDYVYGGFRTEPAELGWRYVQLGGLADPEKIANGLCDEEIIATYHAAAEAEYYYTYEKDWGSFD